MKELKNAVYIMYLVEMEASLNTKVIAVRNVIRLV